MNRLSFLLYVNIQYHLHSTRNLPTRFWMEGLCSSSNLFPSFSSSKSRQVSRTLHSILADLNTAAVWIASIRPLISKSSSPLINTLVTVPRALITIGINVTFMFRSFFQFPSKVEVFILLFTFFRFYSVVTWDGKVHNFASFLFPFFFFFWILWGLVV